MTVSSLSNKRRIYVQLVVILIIVVEAALHIVLFFGAGQIEDHSAHDSTVNMIISRNVYQVMTAGVLAIFASMFAEFTPFQMGTILLVAFLLAEITNFGSQIFYYRRSA